MSSTPLTQLEAVNRILRNLGETPVNSLEGNIPLEASQANDTLNEVSKEFQLRGWFFNREVHTLSPDNLGNIRLPLNATNAEACDGTQVTIRNGLLYNMTPENHGNIWTEAKTLKLTMLLSFTDLPASARNYVSLEASALMQIRELGDVLLSQSDQIARQRAWNQVVAEQNRAEPQTMRNSRAVSRSLNFYSVSY